METFFNAIQRRCLAEATHCVRSVSKNGLISKIALTDQAYFTRFEPAAAKASALMQLNLGRVFIVEDL